MNTKQHKLTAKQQTSDRLDTLLSLHIVPFYIVRPGAIYGLEGSLMDSNSKPLHRKKISFSVGPDPGSLPPISDTRTNNEGTYKVNGLRAPTTEGWYNIQAHFEGGGRYNPSDSHVVGLWVNKEASTS